MSNSKLFCHLLEEKNIRPNIWNSAASNFVPDIEISDFRVGAEIGNLP